MVFTHTHTHTHIYIYIYTFFFLWRCGPTRVMASSFLRFLDHTQRRTTVGRTSLDEWSVRRRDLYLTTYNIHNRQISMPPVGFEPTISTGERPKTYAVDRAATGTGTRIEYIYILFIKFLLHVSAHTAPSSGRILVTCSKLSAYNNFVTSVT